MRQMYRGKTVVSGGIAHAYRNFCISDMQGERVPRGLCLCCSVGYIRKMIDSLVGFCFFSFSKYL